MLRVIDFLRKGIMAFALAVLLGGLAQVIGAERVFAQGGQLAVSPTRVVLEGRTRSAQLSLVNKGSKTATFRIRIVNMRMDESGNMQEVDRPDPGQQFAGKLIRYSPRQVTLNPGASQAIRVLVRKPKNLAHGEYRSHLILQNVPDKAGISLEQTQGTDGVNLALIPIFGITVPVIVRHGKTSHSVELSDVSIVPADEQNKVPRLKFTIGREGTRSAFGDLTAIYDVGGKQTVVGQIMRLAVYTPNAKRTVMMPLRVPDGTHLKGGNITLTYSQIKDAGGKLLSEAQLSVP